MVNIAIANIGIALISHLTILCHDNSSFINSFSSNYSLLYLLHVLPREFSSLRLPLSGLASPRLTDRLAERGEGDGN